MWRPRARSINSGSPQWGRQAPSSPWCPSEHADPRKTEAGLEQLTHIAIDHLLSVPLVSLVNPEVLASQIAINWQQSARSEQCAWYERRRADSRRDPKGSLRDHMAPGLTGPLQAAISKPMVQTARSWVVWSSTAPSRTCFGSSWWAPSGLRKAPAPCGSWLRSRRGSPPKPQACL